MEFKPFLNKNMPFVCINLKVQEYKTHIFKNMNDKESNIYIISSIQSIWILLIISLRRI